MDKPWMDADLPVERRVELLLDAMTLAEKIGQLHQPANISSTSDAAALRDGMIGSSLSASGATAGNIRDAGVAVRAVNEVQRIAVEESRLGIPVLFARDVIHGHRTMLPIPLGQAASWDERLVERGARLAAQEASAVGIHWTFAPMMDITGDHRWGRVAESLGEDPVLAGRLAAAMVRGFQTDDLSAEDAIAACAKHFVGYGLAEGGRDYDTVTAGENSLRNLQLRPFRDAVDAGVATVMSSFNDVDGVPMHANRRYLREILKQEWGFNGVVVSDWEGIGELVWHRVAQDLADAARQGIEAGVDIDMVSRSYVDHLAGLVQSGQVPEERIDEAVRRVLRLKFRCGLFEHPYTDESREARVAGSPAHRAIARELGAASFVLLKNDAALPLSPGGLGRTMFTGPLLEATDPLMGTWTLDGRPEEVVPIASAIAERVANPTLIPWTHSDEVLFHARMAETVVAFVGEHSCRSGEANSIASLGLPPGQLDVLQSIHELGKRLIVVVFAGRPLDIRWIVEHADAVLWAWHPGSEAGHAVADVLFGDAAPRGRLPVTFPRSVGQLPTAYNRRSTGRPIPLAEDSARGRYQDSLSAPLFPFGFGLTYGDVRYSPVSLSDTQMTMEGSITAAVTVRNVGAAACTEVVQCYIHDEVAEVTRPIRELYDYSLVELEPGQSAEVSFVLTAARLSYHGRDMSPRIEPGLFQVWIAADSSSGQPATFRLV